MPRQEEPPEQTGQYAHWQEEAGSQRTQCEPSSDMPPPGTIICTCGWWVIAEPQLWSTAVMPMWAPRWRGSGSDGEQRLGRSAEQQVVDHCLVLVGDWSDLGGQREDQMEIADRPRGRRASPSPPRPGTWGSSLPLRKQGGGCDMSCRQSGCGRNPHSARHGPHWSCVDGPGSQGFFRVSATEGRLRSCVRPVAAGPGWVPWDRGLDQARGVALPHDR